jgi:alpha-ketoglutarate-dependent taurine dioxygenase
MRRPDKPGGNMNINPLGTGFAAEIDGIRLSGSPDDAEIAEIWRAIDEFCVLVFRDQSLTDLDRDRGTPHGAAPPTPPGIRVAYHGGSTGLSRGRNKESGETE